MGHKAYKRLKISVTELKIGQIEVCELYSELKSTLAQLKRSCYSVKRAVLNELGKKAILLAQINPLYRDQLIGFSDEIKDFLLDPTIHDNEPEFRLNVTKAFIILINQTKVVDICENVALFVKLKSLKRQNFEKLAINHVVRSIKRMNQKHKNEAKNQELQNMLFSMVQQEDEAITQRSLAILCDLYKRKVWFDDRTAKAILTACFHPSMWVRIDAFKFLVSFEDNGDDREDIYKAHHDGTSSSKKKKQAKFQRAIRSMKRQRHLFFMLHAFSKKKWQAKFQQAIHNMKKQQLSLSGKKAKNYHSPLNHLKDAQGFTEKLFFHLQFRYEFFKTKSLMLKVISRTIALYGLVLTDFYPKLPGYVQPFVPGVIGLLIVVVQTCHKKVSPEAVEPLLKLIVNRFVHDPLSRTEIMAVGLNVVREICIRMPVLMTEDLLQDLVLYRKWKSHEKAVSVAARSLITLFREVRPSLAIKKNRGRPTNPKENPKANEVNVSINIPGVELLDDDEKSKQFLRACDNSVGEKNKKAQKRKIANIEGQPNVAEKSIHAPKRLAGDMTKQTSLDDILSDYDRITELKAFKAENKARKLELLEMYSPNRKRDTWIGPLTKVPMKEIKKKLQVIESAGGLHNRNIPSYDSSASEKEMVYPLHKIILAEEWDSLLDIDALWEAQQDLAPHDYPTFVRNRFHLLGHKDGEERKKLACIFSYINHLIKFKDRHSLIVDTTKHHRFPSIIHQKFTTMFAPSDKFKLSEEKKDLTTTMFAPSDRFKLSEEKKDLLISYALVLTLFVDNFITDPADIGRDLRRSMLDIDIYLEQLGCTCSDEHRFQGKRIFELRLPLKFPKPRLKRRR